MTRAICILALSLLALVGGGAIGLLTLPAHAATITASTAGGFPALSRPWNLSGLPICAQSGSIATDVGSFTASGRSSIATTASPSTCGDLTSAQVRRDNDDFGRVHEGIHSNDNDTLTWVVPAGIGEAVFAIEDAFDQRATDQFVVTADGASWALDARRPNGNVLWFHALLDPGVSFITLDTISAAGPHKRDGLRVFGVTVAPVPLPAAAWLLLAGLAGLFGLRRTR